MRLLYLISSLWATPPFPHQNVTFIEKAPKTNVQPFFTTSTPNVTVYGYHAYWTGDPNDVDLSPLSHIAVFNVSLQADGSIADTQRWTSFAEDLVSKAHAMGVKVHLCMTSFDDAINNSVLPSASKRARAISELAALVYQFNADGINVDIEGLDSEQRENLNLFIQELQPAVGEVVIATPAVDWINAFDYQTLAEHSDGLFIMGYGYHWSGSDPGPIDPLYGSTRWGVHSLAWSVEDYRSAGTPDDKIILGLPLYGREWPTVDDTVPGTATGDGVAVVMSEAAARATQGNPLYDAVSHTPYLLENTSQLWYCDVDSVRDRIRYAVNEEIQGIGFWALDYEGNIADFWPMVVEETHSSTIEPEDDSGIETEDEVDTAAPEEDTTNLAPTARAGDDQAAEVEQTVTLDGSLSFDPEATALSYDWQQLFGPSITLSNPAAAQTTFVATAAGTYIFQLTVDDGDLLSVPDRITISITKPGSKASGCHHFPSLPMGFSLLGLLIFHRRRSVHPHECYSLPQL